MTPQAKTNLDLFIATARAFFRAIRELEDVERREAEALEIQRDAFTSRLALNMALDAALDHWNDQRDDAHPVVMLCRGTATAVPWDSMECEVYTSDADALCRHCSIEKTLYEQAEGIES